MKIDRNKGHILIPVLFLIIIFSCKSQKRVITNTVFCTHQVVLDEQSKLIPWYNPEENAYDHFLRLRWDFIKDRVPYSPGPDPRSKYPQYYFYCAFRVRNDSILPDTWMNDIGEKIPNWFENARLYYAYCGDSDVMRIIKDFIDYTLEHGTSSREFEWPGFPIYHYQCRGYFIPRIFESPCSLIMHEIQVDHAGEMGLT